MENLIGLLPTYSTCFLNRQPTFKKWRLRNELETWPRGYICTRTRPDEGLSPGTRSAPLDASQCPVLPSVRCHAAFTRGLSAPADTCCIPGVPAGSPSLPASLAQWWRGGGRRGSDQVTLSEDARRAERRRSSLLCVFLQRADAPLSECGFVT